MNDCEELVKFLSKWGIKHGYSIVTPNNEDAEIDYFNINLNTKTIYIGELGINESLTEVG